jgi:riboflavin kinase/FMN adenylyltransferase
MAMKVVRQMSGLSRTKRPVCLAVGFFDGVHLGHQEVLRQTLARAHRIGGEAWVMTFDPHPLKILTPDSAPQLLTDTRHKLELLSHFGLDGCILVPFNRRFAATPAEDFLKRLERGIPTLHSIFMGNDWRFGHKGRGDIAMLTAWAKPRNITVRRVPSVRYRNQPVSSTRIRAAVTTGKLPEAAALLGRPFSILGTVVPGNRIGRKLGYPTANLDPHNEASPPMGVYAAQAIVNRRAFPGVVSFGHHPTVARASRPVLELHLMDTRMNLYRRRIEVFLLQRLRPEKRFPDLQTLTRQIARDVMKAKRTLATAAMKNCWIKALQRWHPESIVPSNK